VFRTSQQVGASSLFLGGACDAQIAPNVAFQEVFVAPHHSYHSGEARVHGRTRKSIGCKFFPPSLSPLSPPRKWCWPLQKKTRKHDSVC